MSLFVCDLIFVGARFKFEIKRQDIDVQLKTYSMNNMEKQKRQDEIGRKKNEYLVLKKYPEQTRVKKSTMVVTSLCLK